MGRVIILLAALCLSVLDTASAADLSTVRFGLPKAEGALGRLSQTIAQKHGFFAREGINVQIVWFDPAPQPIGTLLNQFAALTKGDIDMTRSQVPFLVDADLKGADFVAVSTALENPVFFLVGRPDVKTFAALKGKTVALTLPNDGITLASRKVMEIHGLGTADVKVAGIGGSTPRVECMKSGQCAAAALSEPSASSVVKYGYNRLGVTNEAGSLLFDVEIASRGWSRTHRQQVDAYIKAEAAAIQFIRDPKDHDEVIKTAMELTGVSEADARNVLKYYWDEKYKVLPKRGEIDVAAFNRMIALEGQYGALSAPLPAADRFIDLRFLKEANIQ